MVTEKLLKLQEIKETTWHEAHRIYREEGDIFAYRDILEIFLDVVKATFTGNLGSAGKECGAMIGCFKVFSFYCVLLPKGFLRQHEI